MTLNESDIWGEWRRKDHRIAATRGTRGKCQTSMLLINIGPPPRAYILITSYSRRRGTQLRIVIPY